MDKEPVTKYTCKDNGCKLRFFYVDGEIDELLIKAECDTSWIVIGYKDLMKGIKKAKRKAPPPASQKRYREYFHDDSGLSFREWLEISISTVM